MMRYRTCVESRVCTYRARRRDMHPHRESVVPWALYCGGLPVGGLWFIMFIIASSTYFIVFRTIASDSVSLYLF